MRFYERLRFAAYAFALVGLAVNANATISGSAWLVPDNGSNLCADNAVLSCIPGSAANATFTLSNNGLVLGFNNGGLNDSGAANPSADSPSIATLGDFINSDAGVVGGTGGVSYNIASASTLLNLPGSGGGTDYGACRNNGSHDCGTIFEFTGTANFTAGETFSVTADDGFSLYVGSSNFLCSTCSDPGPESINTHSLVYGGAGAPTGMQTFTFVYAECCSLPATFSTNLATGGNVPEPTSVLLLGTVLMGLGMTLRRKLKA